MRAIRGDVPDQITVRWLIDHGACLEQCSTFEEIFPAGCQINSVAIRLAAAAGLNLDWMAPHVLTAAAWRDYDEAVAPARDAYQRDRYGAWVQFRDAMYVPVVGGDWPGYFDRQAEASRGFAATDAELLRELNAIVAPALIAVLGLDTREEGV